MNIKLENLHIRPYVERYRTIEYTRNGKVFTRRLRLKEPELHYKTFFDLRVKAELIVGATYTDEHGQVFMCIERFSYTPPSSCRLRPVKWPVSIDCVNIPYELHLVSKPIGERTRIE